jgi:hypothetical protein
MRTNQRPKKLFPPGTPPDYVLSAQRLALEASAPSKEAQLYADASKQVSVSISLQSLSQIECLATRLGLSRARMISQLTDIGLELVIEQFSDKVAAEFIAQSKQREVDLLDEFSPNEEA